MTGTFNVSDAAKSTNFFRKLLWRNNGETVDQHSVTINDFNFRRKRSELLQNQILFGSQSFHEIGTRG